MKVSLRRILLNDAVFFQEKIFEFDAEKFEIRIEAKVEVFSVTSAAVVLTRSTMAETFEHDETLRKKIFDSRREKNVSKKKLSKKMFFFYFSSRTTNFEKNSVKILKFSLFPEPERPEIRIETFDEVFLISANDFWPKEKMFVEFSFSFCFSVSSAVKFGNESNALTLIKTFSFSMKNSLRSKRKTNFYFANEREFLFLSKSS